MLIPVFSSLLTVPCRCRRRLPNSRRGAILLDVFMATLMFVGAVMALSQLGVQSLRLAENSNLERLARLKAESSLAKEAVRGRMLIRCPESRQWTESILGVAVQLSTRWQTTDQPRLAKLEVEAVVPRSQPPIRLVLQKLVFQGSRDVDG